VAKIKINVYKSQKTNSKSQLKYKIGIWNLKFVVFCTT